jgi:hypothetical protein
MRVTTSAGLFKDADKTSVFLCKDADESSVGLRKGDGDHLSISFAKMPMKAHWPLQK